MSQENTLLKQQTYDQSGRALPGVKMLNTDCSDSGFLGPPSGSIGAMRGPGGANCDIQAAGYSEVTAEVIRLSEAIDAVFTECVNLFTSIDPVSAAATPDAAGACAKGKCPDEDCTQSPLGGQLRTMVHRLRAIAESLNDRRRLVCC